MRAFERLVMVGLLSSMAMFSSASGAMACVMICPEETVSVKQAFQKAQVVFIAKVVATEWDENGYGDSRLEVIELYKGRVPRHLVVWSGSAEACNQPFFQGRSYIFFYGPDETGRLDPPPACWIGPDIEYCKRETAWVRKRKRLPLDEG